MFCCVVLGGTSKARTTYICSAASFRTRLRGGGRTMPQVCASRRRDCRGSDVIVGSPTQAVDPRDYHVDVSPPDSSLEILEYLLFTGVRDHRERGGSLHQLCSQHAHRRHGAAPIGGEGCCFGGPEGMPGYMHRLALLWLFPRFVGRLFRMLLCWGRWGTLVVVPTVGHCRCRCCCCV